MTQLHLNSVAVCHVHQEVLDLIDMRALMEEFISRNETHASMFGH